MLYLRQICVSFRKMDFYSIGLEHYLMYWADVLPEAPAGSMCVVRASCNKGASNGVVACLLWQNRHIIDYSFDA